MTIARMCLVALTALFALLAGAPRASRASTSQDLSGRWLMAQLTTTAAHVPIVGDVYATSRLLTIHELRHERDRLHGPGRLCDLELNSGSRFVRTTLTRAFKARLPPPVLEARLASDAHGNVTLRQERRFVVVGARLANPLRDPLPRSASDPHVFDEDQDGHPGLTVEIGGILSGEIYVAQRSWTELSGRMVGFDRFNGSVRFGNEQVVLQATSSFLKRPPATRAVPSRSWFRMARMPYDTGCAAARTLTASWFE
jgi:hypothetical protein